VADGSHERVTRGDLLQKLELSGDTLKELRRSCQDRLSFVAAPYSLDALADLEECGPDAYQVEPPLLGHLPLLAAIAETGRPVFLVAGRCTEDDIAAAVGMFKGNSVTLLHSVYAPSVSLESTALWYIPVLQKRFGLPLGYMGLESGIHDAVAAFALGARTIQKMFTSDRFLPGPSHASSLDRDQLRELVTVIRGLEQSLAESPPRVAMQSELGSAEEPRACLVAAYDLVAGESLGESMLSVKLAPDGIHPKFAESLIGRRLAYDVPTDSPLTFGFIEA
jgi:sialic acid synthase SpsE